MEEPVKFSVRHGPVPHHRYHDDDDDDGDEDDDDVDDDDDDNVAISGYHGHS